VNAHSREALLGQPLPASLASSSDNSGSVTDSGKLLYIVTGYVLSQIICAHTTREEKVSGVHSDKYYFIYVLI
jgi:hypothetical protein